MFGSVVAYVLKYAGGIYLRYIPTMYTIPISPTEYCGKVIGYWGTSPISMPATFARSLDTTYSIYHNRLTLSMYLNTSTLTRIVGEGTIPYTRGIYPTKSDRYGLKPYRTLRYCWEYWRTFYTHTPTLPFL